MVTIPNFYFLYIIIEISRVRRVAIMKIKITEEMKSFYINKYLETYSVTEIMKYAKDSVGRNRIVDILKKEGIYEGLNGPNYLRKKVEKIENTLMQRYGVKNWGQTTDGGYKKQNKIPYEKITFLSDDYKSYRSLVKKETTKNLKNVVPPKYCYYTGIIFADEEREPNPNDPRKRSIDHKHPIILCYLDGISYKKAGSLDNIIFILKYVNSIKTNTTHESFLPIAQKIRKVFLNEGCKSN